MNTTNPSAQTLYYDAEAPSEKQQPIGSVPLVHEITFPDGGLHAWLTVLGSWMVLFCTFGLVLSFGVFNDFYVRDFLSSHSSSDISWIGSIQLGFQFMFGLVAGVFFDKGYFHHVMIFGCTLFTFSMFMLSLAQPQQFYQVLLAQGFGCGIALGMTFLTSVGIVTHWFKDRRALAMGVVFTGTSLGGIAFSLIVNKLLPELGFAWTVRVVAFIVLGLLIIANLLMRTRLPPKDKRPPTPPVSIPAFLRDPVFMASGFGTFFTFLGLFFPFFYLQLFSITKGIDPTLAFYTVAILNGASTVGRILPNFMADSIGIYNVMIPCNIVSGILIFVMLSVNSPGAVIVFSILYGLFSGAVVSLMGPMCAATADHVWEIGARSGLGFFIVSFGGLAFAPIAGALLTRSFTWYRPVVFSGVMVFVGTVLLVLARIGMAKKRGTWRV